MTRQKFKDEARRHRAEAGTLFAEHRREGDTNRGREALRDANAASLRADSLEAKAQQCEPKGRAHGGEAEEADEGKRRWFEPGSVADDFQTQLGEASQGGLMGQLVSYAARSALDKDHRTFEGAKLVGQLASAPARVASTVAQNVGHGASKLMEALTSNQATSQAKGKSAD